MGQQEKTLKKSSIEAGLIVLLGVMAGFLTIGYMLYPESEVIKKWPIVLILSAVTALAGAYIGYRKGLKQSKQAESTRTTKVAEHILVSAGAIAMILFACFIVYPLKGLVPAISIGTVLALFPLIIRYPVRWISGLVVK